MRTTFIGVTFLAAGTLCAQQYEISTIAGGVPLPTPALAVSVPIGGPQGVAVDAAGNAYFTSSNSIFKLDQSGVLSRVAGNSRYGYSGDGGPATNAQLAVSCFANYLDCGNGPNGLGVDAAGNIYVADSGNNRIRRISPSGIITTVAGNGARGFSGDGGPAVAAQLAAPVGVAVDATGNLFIADCFNLRIRMVSPSGIITTFAGNGTGGRAGDGGPATSASVYPIGVATDSAGNLFVADGNLYIADCCYNNRVRKVSPDGTITNVAGSGTPGYSGDGGLAISAQLVYPRGVAVDGAGNLFIADTFVRKVTPSGIITTVAGFAGLSPMSIGAPSGVAIDNAGNLFITEPLDDLVQEISPSGIVTTLAGTGTPGFSGDGGPSTNAQLTGPTAVAVDGAGNVYITDVGNNDYGMENNAVRMLRPLNQSALISAVVDAASQRPDPLSPGKIAVIYGAGLGPALLISNHASSGAFGTSVGGTVVSFNGTPAPILYTSANQVAAIVPYAISGATAQVTVAYQGQSSDAVTAALTSASPSIFTSNQTGAGQAAAINLAGGTVNSAANPVTIGGYLSLYMTGEGQTAPGGVDGQLGGSVPPHPVLPVGVTVGGIPATVQYRGGAPGLVAGLMQVNIQIPNGVQPGGYVPVVVQVGNTSTMSGTVWIAVSGN